MSTPDVRVRLSPEGLAEVLAALKKIEQAGEQAGNRASRGFSAANSVMAGTNRLLGQLGAAVSVGALIGFLKTSAQMADEQGRLAESLGTTVENMTALQFIGRTADADLGLLETTLTRLVVRLQELRQGEPATVAMFRAIGLSAKDFVGKDTVESLEVLARALQGVAEPGGARAAVAVGLLGKQGAKALPVLNALAEEGLARVIARGKELGVVLDEQTVRSIRQANDDFDTLKLQAQGLGVAFLGGLAPALIQSNQIISGQLEGQTDAWKSFGEGAGAVVKGLVFAVTEAFDLVGSGLGLVTVALVGSAKAVGKTLTGDLRGASEEMKLVGQTFVDVGWDLRDRLSARWKTLRSAAEPDDNRRRDPASDPLVISARARVDLLSAALDREVALFQAASKARAEVSRREYDQGLIDVREFYRRRREELDRSTAEELAAITLKQEGLAGEADPQKRAAEAVRLDAERRRLELDHASQVADLAEQERRDVIQLGRDRLEIEGKILEAQGQRHEQAMQQIDDEVAKADLVLRRQGVSEQERSDRLSALRNALTQSEEFLVASERIQGELARLGQQRAAIETQIAAGRITQASGDQQLLDLERQRLPLLQRLAVEAMAAAEATGDPQKIQQARELVQAVSEVDVSTRRFDVTLARLGESARQAGYSAIVDFFSTGKLGADQFRQSVSELASTFLASLRRMAAEALVTKLFQAVGLAPGKKAAGGLVGRSGGGFVVGPGGPTSDTILFPVAGGGDVALSPKEFVVRAAAASQPGAPYFLSMFNRYGMELFRGMGVPALRPGLSTRGLAAGGPVSGAVPAPAPAARRDGRMGIDLAPGLVLSHLRTPAGDEWFLDAAARNRRALGSVLRVSQ